MGSAQSEQSEQAYLNSLERIRDLKDGKWLMRDPNTKELFAVVWQILPNGNEKDKTIMFPHQEKICSKITHQYYMSPEKQFIESTVDICSKQRRVVQIFKWEEHSLLDEIGNRLKEGREFIEKEIWSILCSCVLAMSHFTKNEIIHLTLHPEDIILTQEGQVKILASQLSNFIFNHSYHHGFYYAPETLRAISTNSLYYPSNKASVFTLGISLLATMYVKDMTYLYKENLSIDFEEINKMVLQIKNEEMRQVLIKMLKPAQYERISFPELEEMLFEMLEKSELSSESGIEQIEKLEESILQLKTKQEEENMFPLEPMLQDEEDQNATLEIIGSIDAQTLDEDVHPLELRETTDNSRLSEYKENCANLRNVLADRLNSVSISESLKISDETKRLSFFSGKTSRINGPVYVSEHYNRGRYEGYKENGMRHGYGTFFYEEGGKYCGEWVKNKMQGKGALYYVNGELAYEGEWYDDQLQGFGVLYNESPTYPSAAFNSTNLAEIGFSWIKYEGNFRKDMKSGDGTLFLSNGEYFRGEFKNDLADGKGTFKDEKNKILKGVWEKGYLLRTDQ